MVKKDKNANLKTKEQRVKEVVNIRKKLQSLGLSSEIEGIQEFYNYCKDYVDSGYSWSGKIKLVGTKRILQGSLVMNKNVECFITLKYDANV